MNPRPRTRRYGLSLLAAIIALVGGAMPVIGQGQVFLLFGAVFISAWYGGLGPGLTTTGLIAGSALTMLSITHGPGDIPRTALFGVLLFGVVGVSAAVLIEAQHAARRNAEAARGWLDSVLSSIGDAVIATNQSSRITFVNGVTERLTGWTQAEAIARPLADVFVIISEETGEPATDPVRRVLETGRMQGLANHTILVARDGTRRPIADSAAPIQTPAGGLAGVVMVFRDVTERRQAERDLERLNRELRDNDSRKDEFLAMLAHELRNPLAAIRNGLEVSERSGSDEDRAWSSEITRRQLGHLTHLIDDLLDVSRITRGKIELRRQPIDAADVITSAIEAVRPVIEARKHRLDVALSGDRLPLEADPTRLEQILVNLLTNAAKYTDAGGRLWLTASREGGEVIIKVRDTGVGIPVEVLPKMFELFAQADRSLARSEGGLGIGLTLVRKLTEMHGGTISAFSEGAGLGSEFEVRLPAASDPPAPSPQRPADAGAGATAEPMRMLVIDDHEDSGRGMARLLGMLGHDARWVSEGTQGLDIAREFRPACVLLDIGMPGMDGYEVARRLRSEDFGRDVLLIAVSGYGQDEYRRRSEEAGFDHHLVKPVDPATLAAVLCRRNS